MKLGIIGTGRIAKRAIKELVYVDELEPVAVYNPNYDHALEFVAKQKELAASSGTARLYSLKAMPNLEAFMDAVDAVYIATPHGTHHDYARRMLQFGKDVLCEKPMVFDPDLAKELFELAQRTGVVLMEAIKTAYCPGFKKLEEVVSSGIIGDVVDVEAAFTRLTPPGCREFDPTAHGGSFTEFGTYTMLPIFRFLGVNYDDVRFQSVMTDTGVDGYTKAVFSYVASEVPSTDLSEDDIEVHCSEEMKKGILLHSTSIRATATAKTGLIVKSEGQLLISGTKGYILVPSPWWLTRHFEVHFEDPSHIENYDCEFEADGLRYEFREFARRIVEQKNGKDLPRDLELFYQKERSEAIARAAVFGKKPATGTVLLAD